MCARATHESGVASTLHKGCPRVASRLPAGCLIVTSMLWTDHRHAAQGGGDAHSFMTFGLCTRNEKCAPAPLTNQALPRCCVRVARGMPQGCPRIAGHLPEKPLTWINSIDAHKTQTGGQNATETS